MDCALAIARQYRNRFRIVTRDGQLINAGGSMTGGSAGRSSGILSRANQLEQWQEKVRVQRKKLQEISEQGRDLADRVRDAEQETEQTAVQLRELQQKLAALSAQTKQHQLLLDSVRQTEQQFRAEQETAGKQKQQLQDQLEALQLQTEQLEQQRGQALEDLAKAAGQAQETEQQMTVLTRDASQLYTQLAQAQTECDTVRQALDDLQQMADTTRQTAADHERRIAEYEQTIVQADAQRTQLEQASEQSGLRTGQLRVQLQECGQNRMRLEKNKTETEKQAREIGNEIVSLERRHAEAEADAHRIHSEEQQILDKMWENYELTPTAARPMAHKIDDRQEEEKTAASLRRSIKSLGPVNLAAIEEFSELSERLVFLTEQKDDLEQAERELRGIIEKLTEQMKEIFAASFAQLNRYFGETFQEIFGGGSAELALEDENDILGCGIEIRVTPPGKTLKNLSLLSGGEKAFVAIALYFAILKVRPTPFCVLDEIEAALDDVNVTRFAQYLHRLSDKTQFIVITHRRGTMEEANMLYGVTMQERGVSKLLMLNIEDVEKEMDMEIK